MSSIGKKLEELVEVRDTIKENIATKGVDVTGLTKLTELAPKILDISGGGSGDSGGFKEKKYSFGLLSDIHLKSTDYGTDSNNSVSKYINALTYFDGLDDVEMICVNGDLVALNRTASDDEAVSKQEWVAELELFKTLNETYSTKPVHHCTGNHDSNPRGYYQTFSYGNLSMLIPNYESGNMTGEEVYEYITGRALNYYFEKDGDLFVFHSMFAWDYVEYCRYNPDFLWLKNLLANNTDKRIFLFFHVPVQDTFGLPTASGCVPHNASRIKDLYEEISKYHNVIWFSGHTHYELMYQGDQNYTNPFTFQSGNSASCIQVPACGYGRKVGSPYVNDPLSSQGYLVDVYDDMVVIKGIDFDGGNGADILPNVQFVINM